jgi:hypothetical protein
LAGIFGFGTMLVIWFIVLFLGGRLGKDVSLTFLSNWIIGGISSGAGFILGPDRMLDGFGVVWRTLGVLLFGKVDDRTPITPPKRKIR